MLYLALYRRSLSSPDLQRKPANDMLFLFPSPNKAENIILERYSAVSWDRALTPEFGKGLEIVHIKLSIPDCPNKELKGKNK